MGTGVIRTLILICSPGSGFASTLGFVSSAGLSDMSEAREAAGTQKGGSKSECGCCKRQTTEGVRKYGENKAEEGARGKAILGNRVWRGT